MQVLVLSLLCGLVAIVAVPPKIGTRKQRLMKLGVYAGFESNHQNKLTAFRTKLAEYRQNDARNRLSKISIGPNKNEVEPRPSRRPNSKIVDWYVTQAQASLPDRVTLDTTEELIAYQHCYLSTLEFCIECLAGPSATPARQQAILAAIDGIEPFGTVSNLGGFDWNDCMTSKSLQHSMMECVKSGAWAYSGYALAHILTGRRGFDANTCDIERVRSAKPPTPPLSPPISRSVTHKGILRLRRPQKSNTKKKVVFWAADNQGTDVQVENEGQHASDDRPQGGETSTNPGDAQAVNQAEQPNEPNFDEEFIEAVNEPNGLIEAPTPMVANEWNGNHLFATLDEFIIDAQRTHLETPPPDYEPVPVVMGETPTAEQLEQQLINEAERLTAPITPGCQ